MPLSRSGCSKPRPAWLQAFQGWGIYSFFGQPLPHPLQPLNLLSFNLKSLSLVLSPCKTSLPFTSPSPVKLTILKWDENHRFRWADWPYSPLIMPPDSLGSRTCRSRPLNGRWLSLFCQEPRMLWNGHVLHLWQMLKTERRHLWAEIFLRWGRRSYHVIATSDLGSMTS